MNNEKLIEDLTLVLLYLTRWEETITLVKIKHKVIRS